MHAVARQAGRRQAGIAGGARSSQSVSWLGRQRAQVPGRQAGSSSINTGMEASSAHRAMSSCADVQAVHCSWWTGDCDRHVGKKQQQQQQQLL